MVDFISYAQNFEDIILWRALGHIKNGRYIDIGAQDPLVDSVSLLFYEHGWRGIHVEPTPHYAELMRQARPEDVVIQAAVGAKAGVTSFYEFPDTGLSTLDRQIAKKHIEAGHPGRTIVVPSVTLNHVFSHGACDEVHWLKIDVEGSEKQVLQGWTKSALRPWIVLIESTRPLTQVETYQKWEALILRKGYTFAYFDGLNRFYFANEHVELQNAFSVGPNIFDHFALSGASTSSFCANLNARIRSLEEQREHESNEAQQRLARQEQELSAQLLATQANAARNMQSLAAREVILREQLRASQQHAHWLSQRIVLREQELAKALGANRAESAQLTETVRELNRRLGALTHEIQLSKQQDAEQLRAHQVREQELAHQIRSQTTELSHLDRARADVVLHLDELLQIEREASQQRRQALDSLNRELAAMRNSRSWWLTIYLRSVAGWFRRARPSITESSSQAAQWTEASPASAASNLEALLQHQDQQFVESLYLTLLKRPSDPEGFKHYLGRLHVGVSKIQIVGEVLYSPEGRAWNVELPGLRNAVRLYKVAQLPVVGHVLRLFANVDSDSALERHMRALEQQVLLFAQRANTNFARFEQSMSYLRNQVVQQTDHVRAVVNEAATLNAADGTLVKGHPIMDPPSREPEGLSQLSARARTIYAKLRAAAGRHY